MTDTAARRSPTRLAAAIGIGIGLMLVAVSATAAADHMRFRATAYSDPGGETANGATARRGVVAADPKVLPFGSRIRITGAGRYSGEYTVADAGRAIKGHELDIHMPSAKAAKRFGTKTVGVRVLRRGDGKRVD